MFKKSMFALMALALIGVMAYGVVNSGAWFTDSATSQTNNITTGTLSINDGALSASSALSITNFAPGEKTGDVVFYITNNGTIPLAWFGDLEFGGAQSLKDVIYIDYALMQFEGGNWDEADDNFITDGVGSGLYPSWYNTLASQSDYDVITLDVFDGNNGMGSTPYEFKGALKPGYAYRLTLRFGMVGEAGNEFQATRPLTIKLKVDATQVNVGAVNALVPGQGPEVNAFFNPQLLNQD